MPNSSRQKGDRAERQIVELFREVGLDAHRIPLSGAVPGFKNDIEIRFGNRTLRGESKVRQSQFGLIYRWLAGSDFLCVKADRKPILAIVELDKLATLLGDSAIPTQTLAHTLDRKLSPEHSTIKVSPPSISVDPNIIYPDKPGW